MNNKVKEAISIFAEYAEEIRKEYKNKFDISATIDFRDGITLRITAFRLKSVSIVAFQHLDIRTPEDAEGIFELQQKFDEKMSALISDQTAALLARKCSLEAELAAINAQLNK